MSDDITQRFLFEHFDVRGEIVSLTQSYADVLAKHPYPTPAAALLGELLAANALLCSTLKFEGLLILQARSEGAIRLLMTECDDQHQIRGIAHYDEEQIFEGMSFSQLMPNGILALTIDPTKGKRYQGIVPLQGGSLAACLCDYFKDSEQLPTFFWLCADGTKARGLLLQALPAEQQLDADEREATWQHLTTLAKSLTAEEFLSLDNANILHRLYHEEDIRLFDEQPVKFHCGCSRERSANALISLGEEDAMLLLEEQQGKVTIDCQFCNQQYIFDPADIAQLFATGSNELPSETRH